MTGTTPTRALVVEDHPLMREAVCSLLDQVRPGAERVVAGSVTEALRLIASAAPLDVAVLDLKLPDGDCEPLVRRLRAGGSPVPRIFVLSASSDAADARRILKAGANGYCPKSESAETLAAALRLVLEGHRYVPPLLLDADDADLPVARGGLTERQRDVLQRVGRGLPNKLIAQELGITERTVKAHVQALFDQLGAVNRTHLLVRAREAGLLDATAGS